MDILFKLPVPFFLSVLALIGFSLYALANRHRGWGLPMLIVLGSTFVWYHGDALYNDYEEYLQLIGEKGLNAGWWQVLLFVMTFGLLAQPIHRQINSRFLGRRSQVMLYIETRRLEHSVIQARIDVLAQALLIAWVALMAVALFRVNFNVIGLFAPYLGAKTDPWSRGRMGGGIDAILALAGNFQVLFTAGFGVIAAVARNPRTRMIAIGVCFLAFPFYLFDRTRNTMLATMLPGVMAWILFRVRGGILTKGAVLLLAFLVVNFWFTFVIATRGDGVTQAFRSGEGMEQMEDAKHEGISMFSELGYMNDFFDQGTLEPSWGHRYLAEAVNPIPRALWKNKPTIGVDYAIARGFGLDETDGAGGGIAASIATGMIGQGVVNFGRVLGPMAAALLMALWVGILARQDLRGSDPGRLLLFGIGMILTFNMGRDITLLVLYPYVFGWMMLVARDRFVPPSDTVKIATTVRPRRRRRQQRPGL